MQLDLTVLSAFSMLWLAIVPTPGANTLMVTHVAMTRRASDVGLAILGNMIGVVALASLALLGWSAILEAFPWVRLAVNVLGGLYLAWFGWRLLRRGLTPPPVGPASSATDEATRDANDRNALMLGLVTQLSNAQAIVFITSIYAVTGVLYADSLTKIASVVVIVACNASYLGMLAWLFRRALVRSFYARARRGIEGIVGVLFLALGGRLMLREVLR